MPILFPITNEGSKKYSKNKKHGGVVVVAKRVVVKRTPFVLVAEKVRTVKRVPKRGVNLSMMYRACYPVNEFFCHDIGNIISLAFCFSTCRLKLKLKCKLYMGQLWGCLRCPYGNRWQTCKQIDDCAHVDAIATIVNGYFSYLYGFDHSIIKRMRYGLGYKKNFMGYGPQIYHNVGLLPTNMLPHRLRTEKIAMAHLRKRRRLQARLRKKDGR